MSTAHPSASPTRSPTTPTWNSGQADGGRAIGGVVLAALIWLFFSFHLYYWYSWDRVMVVRGKKRKMGPSMDAYDWGLLIFMTALTVGALTLGLYSITGGLVNLSLLNSVTYTALSDVILAASGYGLYVIWLLGATCIEGGWWGAWGWAGI